MKHGITGLINTGKTTLANKLALILDYKIIEVDDVRREILWNSKDNKHVRLRKDLAEIFKLNTYSQYHWINRELFTKEIFKNPESLYNYSLIATPTIKEYINLKQEDNSFIVWVYLLEEGYDSFINGKIIEVVNIINDSNDLIKSRKIIQINSLFKRNKEADIQYHHNDDINILIERLNKDGK